MTKPEPYVIRLDRLDNLHLMRLADKLNLDDAEEVIYYMIRKFLDANPVRLIANAGENAPRAR